MRIRGMTNDECLGIAAEIAVDAIRERLDGGVSGAYPDRDARRIDGYLTTFFRRIELHVHKAPEQ